MNASSQINKKVYSTFAIVTNNQPLPPEQDRAVLMILESHHGTEYILHSSLYMYFGWKLFTIYWKNCFTLGQFEDIYHLSSQQYQVFWLEIDNSVVFDNDETIEDLSCLVSDYNPSCSTELLDTDQWNEVSLAWLIISAIQMSEKRTFDKTQTFPGMDQATRIHSTSKQGCPTCTEFQLLLPQISGTVYGNPFPILELIFPHRQGLNVGVPEHFKS